jgi:hypothetical protein
MRLRTKVVAATRLWLAIVWASTIVTGTCPSAMLLKFITSEDR